MFNKTLDTGQAGDNVGCLLRGIKREEIERGQVLAKSGSITPHTKFECEVYVLSKEEGGRHTPFFSGYRPQFYFRTTDVTGSASLDGQRRNVHAGRQRAAERRIANADRHGRRRAFRHPRRWPHGRFGRRDEDFGVTTFWQSFGFEIRGFVRPSNRGRESSPRGVAQLAEHWSPKPAVGGSSPFAPAGSVYLSVVGEWSVEPGVFLVLTDKTALVQGSNR